MQNPSLEMRFKRFKKECDGLASQFRAKSKSTDSKSEEMYFAIRAEVFSALPEWVYSYFMPGAILTEPLEVTIENALSEVLSDVQRVRTSYDYF